MVEKILPKLIQNTQDAMLNTRHGAFFGLADVLLGLAGCTHLHNQSGQVRDSHFLRYLT